MTRFRCSLSLLAVVALLPRPAQADPSRIAALRTVAVATSPGVAEAAITPAAETTRVTVEVATVPAEAGPAATGPAPPPPVYRGPTAAERYSAQAHDDRKSGRSLLAAGITVASLSYLFTSLAGALAIDRGRDLHDDPSTPADESRRGDRRRAFGRALLVPGIGPAIAIYRSDRAVRAWAAGLSGLTQALGAGLALWGVSRLGRARRLERLSLSAMGSPTGAQVALQLRF